MISRRILAAAALLCALSAPAHAQTGSFSAVSINPTAGTTNQGLVINQTAPSGGTSTGPVLFNTITVTNPGLASSGTGWDSFGQIKQQVVGLRVNYAAQGAATNNGAFGVANFVSGSTDAYGGALGVTANSSLPGHDLWGLIGYGTVWQSGAVNAVVAMEGEVGISTGGSANYRIGVGANSQGPVQGSVLDAAFSASVIGNAVPGPGTTSASFQHLMALSSNIYGSGQSPIAATGDFFFSDASIAVAHFANLPNVTVTGNVLNFPNVAIAGNGTASFGTGSSGLPATGMFTSCASCGSVLAAGSTNGTSGADGITIKDSSTNNLLFAGVAEAGNTVARFGQVTGNWGELVALGSTNAGLMIGTLTNAPVVIGTNNTARMTLSGAGALTIPGTINGVTIDNTAWSTYTPTITSQGGTLTDATITPTGRWKQFGKTAVVTMDIYIQDIGSGSPTGSLRATLPVAAAPYVYAASVYEYAITGKTGGGFINGAHTPTVLGISYYGGSFWVSGYGLAVTLTYEVP